VKLFQWVKTVDKVTKLACAYVLGTSNRCNVVSRLIAEAKQNEKHRIPHALYNLHKALNKIQQHRPHFKNKQHSAWQKRIDKGKANC
jgi:hypothetical protein